MPVRPLPSIGQGKKAVVSPTQNPLSISSTSSRSTTAPHSPSSCSADSSLEATPTAARISAPTVDISTLEPAANTVESAGKDSRPSTGDSTSTMSDDGFRIITTSRYSGAHDMRPLIEAVSDSFKPTLDGHIFSPQASEFVPRENENESPRDYSHEVETPSAVDTRDSTLSVDISDIDVDLNTAPSTRTTSDPNPLDGPSDSHSPETRSVEGSFDGTNGPEYWDNFRRSVQRSSLPQLSLEERFETRGAWERLIAPTTATQTETDYEKDYDGSNRRNDSLSYEEPETDERSDLSISNIDETEYVDTCISEEGQPALYLPHLRMGSKENPVFASFPTKSDAASSESDTWESSIQGLIDSISIENIARLARDLYGESLEISNDHIDCSVDPSPRVGSKNLFYTISLTSQKYLKEVTPVKWLVRIPINARAFTVADSLWLDSDAKSISFIYNQTSIPVARIYSYSSYHDNVLGVPYVVMDCMKGSKVDDLWGTWGDEEKIRCLSQCIKHLSSLKLYPFQKIGVLGVDYNKKRLCVQGPVIQLMNGETRVSGPYSSSKDYLLDIWNTKIMELKDNTDTESMKSRNHLVLLKLLTQTLIESKSEKFYLSLPEIGGGNVLADISGNVTAFVGWEKVMILPKDLGYARYPAWITQDWVPTTKGKSFSKTTPSNIPRYFGPQLVSELDHSSVAGGSSDNEKPPKGPDAAGDTIDAHEGPENYDELRNFFYPAHPDLSNFKSQVQDFPFKAQDTQDPINHAAGSSVETTFGTGPKYTGLEYDNKPLEYEQWKYRHAENSGSRSFGDMRRRNKRGNATRQIREQRTYNTDAEMCKATTSQDKDRVHKIARWNSLSVKLRRDEITQKEDRRKAWELKPEAEKAAAIKQAYTLPPVVETFKKVVVGPDQTRRLVKVVKTDRDHSATVADEMARYRAIYDDIVFKRSIEDSLATKESLVSSALHTALKDDHLRSHVIPKLAKQVFGEDIRSDILAMVGNSPWAERLLSKLDEQRKANSKGAQSETKVTKPHDLYTHYIYIVEIIFLLGILGMSWYYLDITLYRFTRMSQVVSKVVTSVFLATAVFLFLRVLFDREE